MTETESSFVFRLELGSLVRGDAIFQIRTGAQRFGVECEVVENRGFFESAYQVRIAGPHQKVQAFYESLQTWLTKMRES